MRSICSCCRRLSSSNSSGLVIWWRCCAWRLLLPLLSVLLWRHAKHLVTPCISSWMPLPSSTLLPLLLLLLLLLPLTLLLLPLLLLQTMGVKWFLLLQHLAVLLQLGQQVELELLCYLLQLLMLLQELGTGSGRRCCCSCCLRLRLFHLLVLVLQLMGLHRDSSNVRVH